MMDGNFFIGASLATTLTKLALRYKSLENDVQKSNRMQAEAMLVMSSVLQLGCSGLPTKAITHDDAERLSLCLRSLACPTPLVQKVFTEGCRDALGRMLTAKAEEDSQNQKVIYIISILFLLCIYGLSISKCIRRASYKFYNKRIKYCFYLRRQRRSQVALFK